MQLFTDTQKAQLQAFYDKVVAGVRSRYGEGTGFEGVGFGVDADGKVVSMAVDIIVQTPLDVDGDTLAHHKQIEVWG